MEYRKCTQNHIKLIAPQGRDTTNQVMYLAPEYAKVLAENFSLSAWEGSKCLGAAGIIQLNHYRGIAWALLGKDCGKHLFGITKMAKKIIDESRLPRIEITVDYDFAEGHKWARLLGFHCEAEILRKHGILGNDETLYARIKE